MPLQPFRGQASTASTLSPRHCGWLPVSPGDTEWTRGDTSEPQLVVRPVSLAMICAVHKRGPCSLVVCNLHPEPREGKWSCRGAGGSCEQGPGAERCALRKAVNYTFVPPQTQKQTSISCRAAEFCQAANKSQTPPPTGREGKIITSGMAAFVPGNTLSGTEVGLRAHHTPASWGLEAPQRPCPCRQSWQSPPEPAHVKLRQQEQGAGPG